MNTPHPEHIGRYRIDGVLGHGGMGVVYLGFDPGLGRRVAIKTVRKELQAGQAWNPVERFQREARAAARLSHPHVVTVYELCEDAHSACLVCEHVAGTSLEAELQRRARPPLTQALRWMEQLLDALQHVHAHGIVHRDVKASNLLLTPGGDIKLTDFGIAHVDTAPRTQVGLMIGTPGCMAPEQMRGSRIDGRADTFAAGVLMYELLTGRRPWSGSAEELMEQILSRAPLPPSALRPEAAALDAVVLCALAPTPAQRFESAAAFREAIQAACAGFADATATRPAPPVADATRRLAHPQRQPVVAPSGACSAALLQRVETTLRSHVGPIAGVLVSRAARSAADFDALLQQLARHIPARAERERFLDTLHGVNARVSAAALHGADTRLSAGPLLGCTGKAEAFSQDEAWGAAPPLRHSRAGALLSGESRGLHAGRSTGAASLLRHSREGGNPGGPLPERSTGAANQARSHRRTAPWADGRLGGRLDPRLRGDDEVGCAASRLTGHARLASVPGQPCAAPAPSSATPQSVPHPATAPLDEAQVAKVVQRLAQQLGPMAAVAVRRALATADSLPALCRLAARSVPDARARRRFLADCGLPPEDAGA